MTKKSELFGQKASNELSDEEVNFLVDLTRDVIEVIKRETIAVDFWESYTKQKRLKTYIGNHLLQKLVPKASAGKGVAESPAPYHADSLAKIIFNKRNEITQKLLELAYYHYGK